MTALPRFVPLVLAASLCLSFSGCRRQNEEAPPPAPSATEEGTSQPGSMPPPATAPGPDASVGVPPPGEAAAMEERRSAGEVVDDAVITTRVKAALVAEPNLKAGDINVDTHEGEVTLSGYLDTQEQIDRAVQLARTVEGVKNVVSKLSLRQ